LGYFRSTATKLMSRHTAISKVKERRRRSTNTGAIWAVIFAGCSTRGSSSLNDAKSEPSTVAEFCTGESVLDALTSHQAIRNRRTFRPSAALDARPARTSSPDDVQDSTETFLAAFVPRAIDRATSAAKRSGSFRETTARVLSSTPLCSRLGPVGEKSD